MSGSKTFDLYIRHWNELTLNETKRKTGKGFSLCQEGEHLYPSLSFTTGKGVSPIVSLPSSSTLASLLD